MRIVKAKALKKGDTIRLVSPASSVDPLKVLKGVRRLESAGFNVELGENVKQLRRRGFLSASDSERAREVMEAFEDSGVQGIVCLLGGYGSMRILDELNYRSIRRNPKVFVGYSDITAMHSAIFGKTGLVTFHGPMAGADLGEGSDYTVRSFLSAVTSTKPLGLIRNPVEGPLIQAVVQGRAEGRLIGGNLSLVAATLGTRYELDTRGRIMFLEDINEQPYRVDRMLTQLLLAGLLQSCSAVVFGETLLPPEVERGSPSLEEVVSERLGRAGRPAIHGLCIGHGKHKATIPVGVLASLDADRRELRVIEAATT